MTIPKLKYNHYFEKRFYEDISSKKIPIIRVITAKLTLSTGRIILTVNNYVIK